MAGTRKHKGLDRGSKQWHTGSDVRARKGYKVKAQKQRQGTILTIMDMNKLMTISKVRPKSGQGTAFDDNMMRDGYAQYLQIHVYCLCII